MIVVKTKARVMKLKASEFINFYYPEQSEFEFRLSSMYDAEGLLSIDDYLLIFTKNRAKKITEIYKISKTPGSQIAKKIGSLDCQSIVTGADYNKNLKLLVLTATVSFEEYYILKLELVVEVNGIMMAKRKKKSYH